MAPCKKIIYIIWFNIHWMTIVFFQVWPSTSLYEENVKATSQEKVVQNMEQQEGPLPVCEAASLCRVILVIVILVPGGN